jgi:hypothetical protein
MVIWTAWLNSFDQVQTLIIPIKLYKRFYVYQNTRVYSLEPRLQEGNRVYFYRACDDPETKYILLKGEYYNKYNNTNI